MVRNLAELGPNLQKIMTRLLSNQDLVKYLYYSDKDPLSGADLTEKQIQEEVFEKLIKIVPRVGPKEDAISSSQNNKRFRKNRRRRFLIKLLNRRNFLL